MKPTTAILCILLSGCGANMGEACEVSVDCTAGGTCLKGVCAGYACNSDEDCTEKMVCGDVLGSDVCATECETDDDCSGEQTCDDVDNADASESNQYCL